MPATRLMMFAVLLGLPSLAAELDLKGGVAHWAFQELQQPVPPSTKSQARVRNPIDAFVIHAQEQAGVEMAKDADPSALLRRIYLDLIGLPPTPDEHATFLKNPSDHAYAAVVDDLLSRPQYGERWARHWLDVVRYAETKGYERDDDRKFTWRYRDYVIDAFNDDMPYSQFIHEQLAGDELPDANHRTHIATTFLRLGPYDTIANSRDVAMFNQLDDIVATTAQTFMGQSIQCARCHDHKFEPFSQVDYYRMLGAFDSLNIGAGEKSLKMSDAEIAQNEALVHKMMPHRAELEQCQTPILKRIAANPMEDDKDMRVDQNLVKELPKLMEAMSMAIPAREKKHEDLLKRYQGKIADAMKKRATDVEKERLAVIRADLDALEKERVEPVKAWIFADREKRAMTRVKIRGDVKQDGEEVPFGIPVVFNMGMLKSPAPGRLPGEQIIDDFEADFSKWTVTGDAFGQAPKSVEDKDRPKGMVGNSAAFSDNHESGNSATGTLSSPEFVLNSRYLSFYIAGGNKKNEAGIKLHSGEELLINSTGANNAKFKQHIWDLEKHLGQSVQLQIFDSATSGWGYVAIDSIMLSDERPANNPIPEQRRLWLANWLTDEGSPLAARVMANRVWQYHFGDGFLDNANNFGLKAGRPTHPALLEWLAADFRDNGWSLKRLHRQIVSSSTYRQSAFHDAPQADPQNTLLTRWPIQRLQAEIIRDSLLAVSGQLNLKSHGPSVYPPIDKGVVSGASAGRGWKNSPTEEAARRSIYVYAKRAIPLPELALMDLPEAGESCAKRKVSTTAIQSLLMLNGRFPAEQAEHFASRLRKEAGDVRDSQIRQAFQLALCRPPTSEEMALSIEFFEGKEDPTAAEVEAVSTEMFISEVGDFKEPFEIDLDVRGTQRIYLVLADGGDGIGNDWGNWLNPRFVGPSGDVGTTTLKWVSATTGWNKVELGKSANGGEIKVGDKVYGKESIGTHADSLIVYDRPEGSERFKAQAVSGRGGKVQFMVFTSKVQLEKHLKTAAKSAKVTAVDPLLNFCLALFNSNEFLYPN